MSAVPNTITEQAVQVLDPGAYRTDAWYEARRDGIAASEIAAVLGISPDTWGSPFDLWWEKRTGDRSQPDNAAMRRGHRYEALILEDFAESHPEFTVRQPVGLCVNLERPWQMCTPDALAYDSEVALPMQPDAVVQAKSGARRDEWGDEGTDDIPVHYRAQVLWEMDTLGLNVAYVPVVFGFDYREYVVEYDETDVKLMREAAQVFLESVREDRMPDVDASAATRRRLKRLHPTVTDGEAEVGRSVVAQYHAAKRLRDAAQERMDLAEARVRHALGAYKTATVDQKVVATRSVYDVAEAEIHRNAYTVNRLNWRKP